MPIIRRKLEASSVYPDDLRYNSGTDTVQSNINGVWTDNPQADPRHQTTFPPRLTSDTPCDAAQSVVDALKAQIDGILEAIDGGKTAFTIAGIVLSLFTFGVFGVFISIALGIADAMLGAGTTALNAALTPGVYHTLVCILRCNMTSQGRLTEETLAIVKAQVNVQIGGLGAVTLNSMLSLAGEGGINNLGSLGTSTGDCSDCGCFCDMDLWSHVGLGTELERGDNYVIIQSVNVPGLFGDHRVVIDTTDFTVCCPFYQGEYIGTPPTGDFPKYIICGTPFVDEGSFAHGAFPSVGQSVWAVGVDAASPFVVKFTFL